MLTSFFKMQKKALKKEPCKQGNTPLDILKEFAPTNRDCNMYNLVYFFVPGSKWFHTAFSFGGLPEFIVEDFDGDEVFPD